MVRISRFVYLIPHTYTHAAQDMVKSGGQQLLHMIGTRFERVALIPNFREVAHEMHVKEELMVVLNIMIGLATVCVSFRHRFACISVYLCVSVMYVFHSRAA